MGNPEFSGVETGSGVETAPAWLVASRNPDVRPDIDFVRPNANDDKQYVFEACANSHNSVITTGIKTVLICLSSVELSSYPLPVRYLSMLNTDDHVIRDWNYNYYARIRSNSL